MTLPIPLAQDPAVKPKALPYLKLFERMQKAGDPTEELLCRARADLLVSEICPRTVPIRLAALVASI